MRAIDAKTLEELEMLYGDKDCFASLQDWFGDVETYWTNLERLLMVADYAKKHELSATEEITKYSKRIVELFHQTKDYANTWNSNQQKNCTLSTKDYVQATDESWDNLDAWTISQENLRQQILDLIELLYSNEFQL